MTALNEHGALKVKLRQMWQRCRRYTAARRTRTSQWRIAAQTHPGKVRTSNEDALLVREAYPLLAVADGMGGHRAGDVASAMIIDNLAALELAAPLQQAQQQITQTLKHSNQALIDYAQRELNGDTAGSTVVVMITEGNQGICLWAGDSRLYRIRQQQIEQLSRDHSYVAQMVAGGLMSLEDARNHPYANIITRAVGAQDTLDIESTWFTVMPGDIYLLCSDGIYNEIDDQEILAIVAGDDVTSGCTRLTSLCLERGARDNLSLIIAEAPAGNGHLSG